MRAWLAGVKQPEHRKVLERVDALIAKNLKGVVRAIKWRKPPSTKMAGTWNRGTVKARRYDLPTGAALDEKQLVSWLKQLSKLPGFGDVEAK